MATRKTRTNNRANWRTNTRTARSRQGGKPWSAKDIAFMRKFYRCNETSWVARQLGRTVYSVRYKASSLNIRKATPSVWKGNTGVTKPAPRRFKPTSKTRFARTTRWTPRPSRGRRPARSGRR
jgi:hypothetical protein